MKKSSQGVLLAGMLMLILSGCGSCQADDSSLEPDLSSQEPITVGNPEGNPSGPYLVTSKTHEVFMSWTEENRDGEGRHVFMAPVTNDGPLGRVIVHRDCLLTERTRDKLHEPQDVPAVLFGEAKQNTRAVLTLSNVAVLGVPRDWNVHSAARAAEPSF